MITEHCDVAEKKLKVNLRPSRFIMPGSVMSTEHLKGVKKVISTTIFFPIILVILCLMT